MNPPIFQCPSVQGEDFDIRGEDSRWSQLSPNANLSLHLWIDLWVNDKKFRVKALVDTGAEVNVIKRGLLPESFTHQNAKPITLTAADSSNLKGGQKGVSGDAILGGNDMDTAEWTELHCPIHLYEANITVPCILSYGWLANQKLLVN